MKSFSENGVPARWTALLLFVCVVLAEFGIFFSSRMQRKAFVISEMHRQKKIHAMAQHDDDGKNSDVSEFGTPPPYPWQWIHPWKTGTSFANTLYMLGCPEDAPDAWTGKDLEMRSVYPQVGIRGATSSCKRKWTNGHGYAYATKLNATRAIRKQWWIGDHAYRNTTLAHEQLFMSLRDPVDRIISQFFYQIGIKNVKTNEEMAQRILQHKQLHTPLLGQHMISLLFPPHQKLEGDNIAHEACRIVENMAWIGFADDYERSVCLLHARYKFPFHPLEKKNTRPTASRNESLNATAIGILVRNQTKILDDVVYNCARERFLRELKELAPQCL